MIRHAALVTASIVVGHTAYRHVGSGPMPYWSIENTAPAEPFVCGSGNVGRAVYVDDTDDLSRSTVCLCAKTNDATFDWIDMTAVSSVTGLPIACPFF